MQEQGPTASALNNLAIVHQVLPVLCVAPRLRQRLLTLYGVSSVAGHAVQDQTD
jgi:hypothetical protein